MQNRRIWARPYRFACSLRASVTHDSISMSGSFIAATSPWPHYGTITRVTGFLWDRGRDRLWRQGIDLIGDDRRRQVSESIEDGAMLGKSEGGESLDVTDDGLDDVAPVEQGLVEERHR